MRSLDFEGLYVSVVTILSHQQGSITSDPGPGSQEHYVYGLKFEFYVIVTFHETLFTFDILQSLKCQSHSSLRDHKKEVADWIWCQGWSFLTPKEYFQELLYSQILHSYYDCCPSLIHFLIPPSPSLFLPTHLILFLKIT